MHFAHDSIRLVDVFFLKKKMMIFYLIYLVGQKSSFGLLSKVSTYRIVGYKTHRRIRRPPNILVREIVKNAFLHISQPSPLSPILTNEWHTSA